MTAQHRTLILGEAPGPRSSGRSQKRVGEYAGRPWEEWADWINLLDEWPGAGHWGQGSAWNAQAARRRADGIDFAAWDAVILLGRRVAGSVLPGGGGIPWYRWITHREVRFVVIPHTSGVNRHWNDPANVARASEFLRQFA